MKHKALLVDDDPKICESVSEILASLGHEHQQAHSQEAARALLAQGEFSYILLDLEIPVRDGGGFARLVNGENLLSEIRKMPKMRGVPVIVMTGYGSTGPSLAVRLMKKGAVDFVNKPFDGDVLDRAILDALRPAKPHQGHGPAEMPGSDSLHERHIKVLRALARLPGQAMLMPDLQYQAESGKHTLVKVVKRLLELGYIAKPVGTKRAGVAITDTGITFLRSHAGGTQPTNSLALAKGS